MSDRKPFDIIVDIAKRADEMGLLHFNRLSLMMDLECANEHYNLALEELLNANNLNFSHDISGIQCHIDRDTKSFDPTFTPRFARGNSVAEKTTKPKHDVERD